MPQEISSLTPRLICIGIDLIRMHCSAAGVALQTRLKAEAKCDADAQGITSASRNERKLCR
jgi:hypothetical protein